MLVLLSSVNGSFRGRRLLLIACFETRGIHKALHLNMQLKAYIVGGALVRCCLWFVLSKSGWIGGRDTR